MSLSLMKSIPVEGLSSLNLTNFNMSKVTKTSNMFYSCSNLETILCDDDWSKGLVTPESSSNMFYGCYKLKGYDGYENANDITFANPTTGYFTGRDAYAVYDTEDYSLTFYYDLNKATYEEDNYKTVFPISGVEWNPAWAVGGEVNSVRVDESFQYYNGLTSTAEMFSKLYTVTAIEGLEYLNTENVTDMGSMFVYSSQLESLELKNFNTSQVTSMSGMFWGCYALTSLDLSGFDTGNVSSMDGMFYDCNQLTTIYCNDNWQKDGLSDMEMFYGCYKLVGAVSFNESTIIDASMANPDTGYFTRLLHIAIDETNFPDEHFRKELLLPDFDKNQDGWFTTEEILGITEMNLNWRNIADLTGIEYFIALKNLYVSQNDLTMLDLSANTALEWLVCNSNQLTYINLDQNKALRRLECQNNQLTSLDVSCCPVLGELLCNINQLTSLILNKWDQTTSVTWLDCSNNNLTRLENMRLTPGYSDYRLYCHNNPIRNEGMDELISALITLGSGQQGTLRIYDETFEGVGAYCTSDQVTAARNKGWEVQYFDREAGIPNGTLGEWLSFDGFSTAIGDMDGDGDIDITDANIITDYILGKPTPATFSITAADVNNDGRVSIADVTAIINILAPAVYDPTADKEQLNTQINQCTEILHVCIYELETKDSEHNQTALWSLVNQIRDDIDAASTAVKNATTKSDIAQCESMLASINGELSALRVKINEL